ncbi:MAG: helix-turn-helix domain-containing protein [Candidatus Omnitrophica bacterium]|nr:helix-turn-helix domain-containing protein [Candidatus Omnitrophota bacterium]
MTHKDKLLNLKEAAEYLHISQRRLEKLVRKGKLPAYKIGGSYLRFRKDDIDNFRGLSFRKERKYNSYSLLEGIKDFLYFNSFYIISIIIALIMLIVILKF